MREMKNNSIKTWFISNGGGRVGEIDRVWEKGRNESVETSKQQKLSRRDRDSNDFWKYFFSSGNIVLSCNHASA